MRKKKKETAPAPVETDFYTEALKAFDVVLPPTQEELEAQRRAEEEKARKRVRWRRGAIFAAVAAVTVALLLWRPWGGSEDPTLPSDGDAAMSDAKLTFHVYTVPGSYDVSVVPTGGTVELTKEQMDSLLTSLEALKWSPSTILSSIPPAPIGDFTFTRDGQQYLVRFNGYGTLFADMYLAKPDTALWNELFSLLQQQSDQAPIGRFVTQLTDGRELYLDIQKDDSFVVLNDSGILYSGYWGRVAEYLLLYTSNPRIGFAILRVGNDGGLAYLETHDLWLLQELRGQPPLYSAAEAAKTVAQLTVRLSMHDGGTSKTEMAMLNRQQRDLLLSLLDNAQWSPAIVTGSMPNMCGKVNLLFLVAEGQNTTGRSIQFSHDGIVQEGNLFAMLDDEDWMAFVKLLGLAGSHELAYRSYMQDMPNTPILLQFTMDGRFEYRNGNEAVIGNYLQLGEVVLLAGQNGLRELLFWERDSGDLITQSGEVLEQIPILYGTT